MKLDMNYFQVIDCEKRKRQMRLSENSNEGTSE
jgi:hypothetical protein